MLCGKRGLEQYESGEDATRVIQRAWPQKEKLNQKKNKQKKNGNWTILGESRTPLISKSIWNSEMKLSKTISLY